MSHDLTAHRSPHGHAALPALHTALNPSCAQRLRLRARVYGRQAGARARGRRHGLAAAAPPGPTICWPLPSRRCCGSASLAQLVLYQAGAQAAVACMPVLVLAAVMRGKVGRGGWRHM